MITIKLESKSDILALFSAIKEMTEPQQAERWFNTVPLGDFNCRSAVRDAPADTEIATETPKKAKPQIKKGTIDKTPADVKIDSEEPGIVKPLAIITQSGYAVFAKWRSLYKPSNADIAKRLEVNKETATRLIRCGGWTQELAEKLASFVPGLIYENGKLTGDISKVTAPEKVIKTTIKNKAYSEDVREILRSRPQRSLAKQIGVAQSTIAIWLQKKCMPVSVLPRLSHSFGRRFYLDDDDIIKVEA